MSAGLLEPIDLTPSKLVRMVMWPLALVTAGDTVFQKALPGHHTNDFKPVHTALRAFLRHEPVYTANLFSVDPHYLYPPGGTLLLAPLGLFDEATGRAAFLAPESGPPEQQPGLVGGEGENRQPRGPVPQHRTLHDHGEQERDQKRTR